MAHHGVTHDDKTTHLWDLIDKVKICMMTTRDGGHLRSRPMYALVEREEGRIYFLTADDTHKTGELQAGGEINLAFQDTDDDIYVSLSGQATLSKDAALIERLWNPGAEAWLGDRKPEHGAGDVVAIIVEPRLAEFWDDQKSSISQAYEFVKGLITDEQPNSGENRKVGFGAGKATAAAASMRPITY